MAWALPLPQGWEMKIHDDGRPYYLDHSTKTTSWTAPSACTAGQPPAEGHLNKKGSGSWLWGDKYKRFLFSLEGSTLKYFDDKRILKGEVDVSGATVRAAASNGITIEGPNILQACELQSQTEAEQEYWVHVLHCASARVAPVKQESPTPTTSAEGIYPNLSGLAPS